MFARTARSRKLKNSEKERRNKARCKCGPRWRVEKERKRTFEERERERIKTRREQEKNSRTWRERRPKLFRHSRNFQRIRRRARSSVSSPITPSRSSPSPFRAVFRSKLREHEEGGRGMRWIPSYFSLPPQFIDTSREGVERNPEKADEGSLLVLLERNGS